MATLQTLRTKLTTVLSTLVGTDQPLVSLYDYHTLENVGYPYASIEPSTYDAERLDNCNVERTYTFKFVAYQNSALSRQDAMSTLIILHDDVIDLLNKNYTLDGIAEWGVLPVWWEFWQLVIGKGRALFFYIDIACKVLQTTIA